MTASQKRGTTYIGVINSLARRVPEHKEGTGSRFTARYGVQHLVWYEERFDIRDAIQREKSLKRWPRQWKIELIEKTNPDWNELFRGTGCSSEGGQGGVGGGCFQLRADPSTSSSSGLTRGSMPEQR
jgi:putative endonuclease